MGKKQPELRALFIDRCLGRIDVPNALSAAGFSVVLHDDLFRPDTQDEHWIRDVAKEGLPIITKDRAISRRPLEIEAFRSAKAYVFALIGASVTGAEQAAAITKAAKRICNIVATCEPPVFATISRSGTVVIKDGGKKVKKRPRRRK